LAEQDDFLDRVTAVARRHGVDPGQVKEVPGGVANRAFVLGDELFLRVSRAGYEDDLRKETHVVPAARFVGVLTPAIVEYDDTRRLVDAPYVVMDRIHGAEPTEIPTALSEHLARLHQLEHPQAPSNSPSPRPDLHPHRGESPRWPHSHGAESDDPPTWVGPSGRRADGLLRRGAVAIPGLPEDDWGDPWRTVDDLARRGYVDPGTASWLTGWFGRLAERFEGSGPKVLIHGDVAAHNLLAGPDNELRALIDWGDAAWAPRAMEFAKLPLIQVAGILPAYVRHSSSHESEEELAAAILWFHLSWALSKLPAPPWPDQRHWTAPTTSRLLNILHFFTTTPPTPWSALT
jgi:aminoglycoside phosphotransferase (APT) family kinase protein